MTLAAGSEHQELVYSIIYIDHKVMTWQPPYGLFRCHVANAKEDTQFP